MAAAVQPIAGTPKVIGTPYSGTHTLGNWESDNAVDLSTPIGTPVYAVEDGTIGPQFGAIDGASSGGRFAGLRLHLNAANGDSFYYAHLSSFAAGIRPGAAVKAGELLGYSGSANGVAHLHFAASEGLSPLSIAQGLPGAVADALTPDAGSSDASASAAGCATAIVGAVVFYSAVIAAGAAGVLGLLAVLP